MWFSNAAPLVPKVAYGYTIESQKPDIMMETTGKMIAEFSSAAVPMGWAVSATPASIYPL